jgi:GTP-binding protein HflX
MNKNEEQPRGRRAPRRRATSDRNLGDNAERNPHASDPGRDLQATGPERELRAAERRQRDRAWESQREAERAILVGVTLPGTTRPQTDEHLAELTLLARTAGADPVARITQDLSGPNVRTFIGKGKVEELLQLCRDHVANLVIFDDTLSPSQARNVEEVLQRNVIDRTELILDIFARHARSREAKMQVELAQLQYMRPRLKQLWDHLSRQNGGIGTRGPGETQLEVDRRRVSEKIARLQVDLRDRGRVAKTQRKSRATAFSAALVGYTNAGKSSLMNALAGTELLTENKLFSTLDATTRRIPLGDGAQALLTDTVGFIRKLPHDLVASFRTTLDEVNQADLLLHVADITSLSLDDHMRTVNEVLAEIVKGSRPTRLVFNKVDALADRDTIRVLARHHPDAFFTSARTGEGLDALRDVLRRHADSQMPVVELEIVADDARILAFCYREGRILSQDATEAGRPLLRVRFSDGSYRKLLQEHAAGIRVRTPSPGGSK